MTKYTLSLTTFKCGMAQKFEFDTEAERFRFLVTFSNSLVKVDYLIHIGYGERTFMVPGKLSV